ncbi:MAG TPA: hypothetical protein VGB19_12175 [Actinomycetota bacterium]
MDTKAFLTDKRREILDAAEAGIRRNQLGHYARAGDREVRRRLRVLLDLLTEAAATRDLGPVAAYAGALAVERFDGGYDLSEVQSAFNALEEAVWSRIVAVAPADISEALGLVSTVLGAGKDALARTYVTLGTRARLPALDLRALFAGAAGA